MPSLNLNEAQEAGASIMSAYQHNHENYGADQFPWKALV